MPEMLVHGQPFDTPEEALAHYGKKGMKWGVITKQPGGSSQSVGTPEDLFSLGVIALYGGITVAKMRINYLDSGKKLEKTLTKEEQKTGVKHEWNKDASLADPKTHEQLMDDVVAQINPGHPSERGTSMNCRRCTLAYEMRRRGEDVKATKSILATGQEQQGILMAITPNSTKKSLSTHEAADNLWGVNRIASTGSGIEKSNAVFAALATQPEGSRGELAMGWAFGGGHSVAYEITGGKPLVICTQTNRSWTDASSFHSMGYGSFMADAAYTRLDNAPLNEPFLRRWVENA